MAGYPATSYNLVPGTYDIRIRDAAQYCMLGDPLS